MSDKCPICKFPIERHEQPGYIGEPFCSEFCANTTAEEKNKDALRKLYNAFDDRADAKEFDITDAALSRLDPRRLRPEVAVGVLTITLPWRRELPARLMFARAVRKHFEAELGLERANKILRGLE